ncbi:polysaccharide deacetylase family protein [Castellaniella sp.]|uniref:polysaccharide deacetylase family protein n=1 Tax=Castellaniella sp. TaxID=1955812 RepID=UPI003C76AB9B
MEPVQWPHAAQCAVQFTFDFDAETNWISRDPKNLKHPGTLSQGTYGAKVGVPKVLELLREEGLKATFFVPGWVAEHRTERVEQILAAGHEVGHHGYLHKWVDPDCPEEELEEMERGLEALQSKVGVRPVGYRSPAGETSPNIIRLLVERGFLYDSSLMDDINPYRHVLPDGRCGPVELPWHWSLDDAPFMLSSIKVHRPIFTNDHIFEIWAEEFREIYRWGGLFTLVMHPQAIGRPSRLALLRRFIAYTRTFPNVWYANAQEVAQAWLDQKGPGDVAPQAISPFLV